jgi:hypothetical protein
MGTQIGQIQVAGRFGKLVGMTGKNGKVYLRAAAPKKNRVMTEKQQIVQSRFKVIQELASNAKPVLRMGLKKRAQQLKCSVYNAFVKENWDNIRCNMPGVTTVNYPEIVFALGNVPNVRFGSPQFDEPLTVQVTFTGNVDQLNADATDKVYIYAYCPDTGEGLMSDAVSRSASTMTLAVPTNWNGMKVHVWGYVIGGENNPLEGTPSQSVYVGTGNIG